MCMMKRPLPPAPVRKPVPVTQEDDGTWRGDIGKAFWLAPAWIEPEGNCVRDGAEPFWMREPKLLPSPPRQRDYLFAGLPSVTLYRGTPLESLIAHRAGHFPDKLHYWYDAVTKLHWARWRNPGGHHMSMNFTEQQVNEWWDELHS